MPLVPRTSSPPSTMAPPTPVPMVNMTIESSASCAAPWRNSAHAAALPSFSTMTGRPTLSLT